MDKNSEAWRMECEIRFVAAMTQDQRKAFYLEVKKRRGEEAANALIEKVNALRRQLAGRG